MAEPDDEPDGVPEWVVTYGDMMSLLLTFFIMIVSLSSLKEDEGAVRTMLEAIRKTFGPTRHSMGAPGPSLQKNSMLGKRGSEGVQSEGKDKKSSLKTNQGTGGQYGGVKRINHGTRISMGGPAYFQRFDARPSDKLKKNLDLIAEAVADKSNPLMIRGHATREPLPPDANLEFLGIPVRNQWDLSFARAVAVAKYLEERGISVNRLIISASGDTEPHKPTREKDVRKLNRRVDVFLIDSYISRPKHTDPAHQ